MDAPRAAPPRTRVAAVVLLLAALCAGPATADAARDLDSLRTLQTRGRWAAAESLATAILARETAGPRVDSLLLARLHGDIVFARIRRSATRDSTLEPRAREALAVRRRRLGPAHPLTAESHHLLAHFLLVTARLDSAEAHARLAHEIRAAALAPGDTLTAESLRLHAFIARDRADYRLVQELLDRALAVRRRAHGEDHASIALLLAEQGNNLRWLHEIDRARETLERSLAMLERTRGRNDYTRTVPLDYLALVESEYGDLDRAIDLTHEAIRVARVHFPDEHDNVARLIRNSSNRLLAFGDFAGARAALEFSLPIYLKRFGPDHPRTLSVRRALGSALAGTRDSAGAMTELRAAEAGFAAQSGPADPQLGSTRLWIGELLESHDDPGAARTAFEAGIASERAARVPQWLTLAELQAGLVRALVALGDTAALARERVELLRLVDRPEAGRSNIEQTLRRVNAAALRALGRDAEAWEEALAADRIARERLQAQVRLLSDRRALQLASLYSATTDQIITQSAGSPARAGAAWDAVIRSRGLVRTELARRVPRADAAPAVRDAQRRWIEAQRTQARLLVAAARDSLALAQERVEQTEMEYARALGHPAPIPAEVGLAECRARLQPRQALVAVVEVRAGHDTSRVVAWIARSGREDVGFVDLGRSRDLRAVLAPWREALAQPPADRRAERECQQLGEAVRRVTWDRLAPQLEGVDDVFLVPDGPLHGVVWQALPAGNRYLVERGPVLRVLTAERDLVAPGSSRPSASLLAVGDPDFGSTGADSARSVAAFRSSSDPCAQGLSGFEVLPGTAAEVAAITASWRGPTETLTGAAATEERFKSLAPGRAVLHLATHGVVAGDTCAARFARARGIGSLSPAASGASTTGATPAKPGGVAAALDPPPSPWMGRRVWLALAGANQAAQRENENEGLLTAEEVVTLDLQGTDWVVLSACHSAAAEAWSRDGARGMRRAFHLAGARTVIASQWAVDDDATREWMTALYEARGRSASSPGAILSDASRTVLASRRAARRSTHPFFWAAFDATGE